MMMNNDDDIREYSSLFEVPYEYRKEIEGVINSLEYFENKKVVVIGRNVVLVFRHKEKLIVCYEVGCVRNE